MQKSISLTLLRPKTISIPKPKFAYFWIFSFCLIFFLTNIYIFQITDLSKQSRYRHEYQKQINRLSKEVKELEIEIEKSTSLDKIDPKIKQLGFEKIEKIYYLERLENRAFSKK